MHPYLSSIDVKKDFKKTIDINGLAEYKGSLIDIEVYHYRFLLNRLIELLETNKDIIDYTINVKINPLTLSIETHNNIYNFTIYYYIEDSIIYYELENVVMSVETKDSITNKSFYDNIYSLDWRNILFFNKNNSLKDLKNYACFENTKETRGTILIKETLRKYNRLYNKK